MRRGIEALLLAVGLALAEPALAAAGPSDCAACLRRCAEQPAPAVRYAVAAEAGAGIGTYNPYGTGRFAFEILLWQRLDLSLNLRTSFSDQLVVVGPALRIGLLLHASDELDLLVAGEGGYGAMQLYLPLGSPWVDQAVFRALLELRLSLPFAPSWELRGTPLAVTAFWSRVWGLAYEPSLSMAHRF